MFPCPATEYEFKWSDVSPFPATEYEFKWSNVSSDLSPSQYATHGVLVNSSLVPAPAANGTSQTLTIDVPAGLSTDSFFMAMRTRDNRGEITITYFTNAETGRTGHTCDGLQLHSWTAW